MNISTPHPHHAFGLAAGGIDGRLRALRATVLARPAGGSVLGHRAFMRAWAARRAGRGAGLETIGGNSPGAQPPRPCAP